MKHIFFTVVLLFTGIILQAQVLLPAFFSDHMVLQQQQAVAIWGKDKPGAKISVAGSWGKKATAVADAEGKWKVKIQTPVAGGPYDIKVKGTDEVRLKDVMIGEVWFCSGQSNMEMPMRGYTNQPVLGSNDAILHSANTSIRFFNAKKTTSITPLTNAEGQWKLADPATTGDCSATAYFFARKLQAVLGVPIGLIHSSWGASSIESWMDTEALSAFPHIKIPSSVPEKSPNQTPTILFQSMLHPFIGYTIKGVIWYQGEANRSRAAEYDELLAAMIQSWRKLWQQGDFPFYFAQIAPFDYKDANAAFLREAQLKTMLAVAHTGMAVTLDLGEKNNIHPAQKMMVGERLAYWALGKTYNIKGVQFSGPVYKQIQVTADGKALVGFSNAPQGLSSFGKPLTGFEIAGEDRVFYSANCTINTDKPGFITVWSPQVQKPVSVRYAFHSWTEASLFNTQGLPASSFRTDDW